MRHEVLSMFDNFGKIWSFIINGYFSIDTYMYLQYCRGNVFCVSQCHTNSHGRHCVKIYAITMGHGYFPGVITEIFRNGWLPRNIGDTMSPVGICVTRWDTENITTGSTVSNHQANLTQLWVMCKGRSRLFKWGGGGAKDCVHTVNIMSMKYEVPYGRGPGFKMNLHAIWALFWSILIQNRIKKHVIVNKSW